MIELWERVEAEWEKVPQDICTKLIYTMPKRIKVVIKSKRDIKSTKINNYFFIIALQNCYN